MLLSLHSIFISWNTILKSGGWQFESQQRFVVFTRPRAGLFWNRFSFSVINFLLLSAILVICSNCLRLLVNSSNYYEFKNVTRRFISLFNCVILLYNLRLDNLVLNDCFFLYLPPLVFWNIIFLFSFLS